MLVINLPQTEFFDNEKQEFVAEIGVTLELEHSLVALSKWESMFEKPFLSKDEKTEEETLAYVKAMIISPKATDELVSKLTQNEFELISQYIDSKMTATWINDSKVNGQSRETITSELIYYWMISLNIPIECQYWHLNRLFTLIRIFGIKNAPKKKMSRSEIAARNRELNQARKQKLGTKG